MNTVRLYPKCKTVSAQFKRDLLKRFHDESKAMFKEVFPTGNNKRFGAYQYQISNARGGTANHNERHLTLMVEMYCAGHSLADYLTLVSHLEASGRALWSTEEVTHEMLLEASRAKMQAAGEASLAQLGIHDGIDSIEEAQHIRGKIQAAIARAGEVVLMLNATITRKQNARHA